MRSVLICEGTRFYCNVEQDIVDEEPIGNMEERIREQVVEYSYDVNFIAPEVRLLVVDDNMVNPKVLVNFLSKLSHLSRCICVVKSWKKTKKDMVL